MAATWIRWPTTRIPDETVHPGYRRSVINPPANAADFVRFYSENIVQFVLGQKPLTKQPGLNTSPASTASARKNWKQPPKQNLLNTGFLK